MARNATYEPHIIRPERDEEVWVQAKSNGVFEVGVQLHKTQFTYVELDRRQIEQFRDNVIAAILEHDE